MRLKLNVDNTRMVIVVDKHTPCHDLVRIIQTKLSALPQFSQTYYYYDKIEIICEDETYQVGAPHTHDLYHIQCIYIMYIVWLFWMFDNNFVLY